MDRSADGRWILSRRSMFAVGAVTLASVGTACGRSSSPSATTSTSRQPNDVTSIATDAYIFGYPLVLMDATHAAAGASNRFDHAESLPTPTDRQVVRLNLDTLYSQAWLDVRAEPMVLQVPAMDADRYWLMQILDAWTNTVHDPGSVKPQIRSGAASPPYTYAITGPGWTGTLSDSVTQLSVPTNTAWVIGRIQVNGVGDVGNVRALQQQMKLVPLSQWGHDVPTPPPTSVDMSVSPTKQVAHLDGHTFFNRLCAAIAANPPAAADAAAVKRFASIGIMPGGNLDHISADDLNAAVRQAQQRIADYQNPNVKRDNGWQFATDVGTYGTDYLLRANIALLGLGANLPQDAVYPTLMGIADNHGTPRRFRLRFPPGQLPPVDAFWSITAYDVDSFLVPNPDKIYAVGHEIPVVPGPDGLVEIAVQNANPGPAVPQGNWLPIPAVGKFSLTMRLYAPKEQALDGRWQPPELTPA